MSPELPSIAGLERNRMFNELGTHTRRLRLN
jgi:hypothetical protein